MKAPRPKGDCHFRYTIPGPIYTQNVYQEMVLETCCHAAGIWMGNLQQEWSMAEERKISLMRLCQLKHYFQLTRLYGNVGWISACPLVQTICLILLYKYFQLFSLKKGLLVAHSHKDQNIPLYGPCNILYLNFESSQIDMHHGVMGPRDASTQPACKGPIADQHTATQTTALRIIISTKLSHLQLQCTWAS